jgi:hypothetical protein
VSPEQLARLDKVSRSLFESRLVLTFVIRAPLGGCCLFNIFPKADGCLENCLLAFLLLFAAQRHFPALHQSKSAPTPPF